MLCARTYLSLRWLIRPMLMCDANIASIITEQLTGIFNRKLIQNVEGADRSPDASLGHVFWLIGELICNAFRRCCRIPPKPKKRFVPGSMETYLAKAAKLAEENLLKKTRAKRKDAARGMARVAKAAAAKRAAKQRAKKKWRRRRPEASSEAFRPSEEEDVRRDSSPSFDEEAVGPKSGKFRRRIETTIAMPSAMQ